ncbi:MAG: lysostaphin resistance A-like protein [Candidatus Babeliales bacterium]
MQATIFNKSWFWVLATAISFSLAYAAFQLFPIAFPIVSIDLTMDRSSALARAQEITTAHNIGPQEHRQAIIFASDDKAKIYIQLEAGGVEKFRDVIKEEYFAPYYWQVRHFKPMEKHEAMIFFMPDGRPYGFRELLPDSMELPNLDKAQAEQLAQESASTNWFIDFSKHMLVEHSTEEKPNGRIDHTLVYERTDAKIADAPYRVTIRISGNKPTKTMVDLKIPESFERRYACMRSANNSIATWSSAAMFLLYILLGCILGLILLVRSNRHWLISRAPFYWALFIALGMALSMVNNYSLWWMYYQTTTSTLTFILSIVQSILMSFGSTFLMLYLSFMAAENLTRKAFPNQVQLWPSADPEVASSWQIVGRTIGGYLMVGFDFIFVTLFYLLSFKYLGWWSPADTLIDPNVLASYAPWFSSVITALRAGFWEECLFRAVPLASAMLLAKRFGKKYLWLGGAMILQAIIFAGAHASYPAQPAYARLVELIIPSFVFGGLYLAFGLIPAIISHVIYDLILMALPIFISDAPGSIVNKAIVILCGLVPLMVLLYARIVKGRFHTLSERWYNGLWQSPMQGAAAKEDPMHKEPIQPSLYRLPILFIGLLGLTTWGLLRHKAQDVKPLSITREQAVERAHQSAQEFNLTIPKELSVLSNVGGKLTKDNLFVWRTKGKEIYNELDGKFIMAPHWKVRSAEFDAPDIAKSAEEYDIYVGHDGSVVEYQHVLPKEQEGATLTQDQARAMTHEVLKTRYNVTPDDVVEVSAREEKQPNRKDWEFIYRLKQGPDLGEGQLRIRITLGGDQITSHDRVLHIPETWERAYEFETKLEQLVKNGSLILLVALMMLLAGLIIRRRPIHPFAVRFALITVLLLVLKTCIQLWNLWPVLTIDFATSAPYLRQVGMLIAMTFIQTVGITVFLGWLAGYTIGLLKGRCSKSLVQTLLQGISIALLISGATAFASWALPQRKPLWLDISNAGAYLPWLSMGLRTATTMIASTLISLFILHGLNMLSDYGRKNYGYLTLVCILLGIAFAGFEPSSSLLVWLLVGWGIGMILFAVYYVALRFNYCIVPILIATHLSIDAVQDALLNAYPGIWLGTLLTIVLCCALAAFFIQALRPSRA